MAPKAIGPGIEPKIRKMFHWSPIDKLFNFGSTDLNVAIGTIVGGRNSKKITKNIINMKTYDFLSHSSLLKVSNWLSSVQVLNALRTAIQWRSSKPNATVGTWWWFVFPRVWGPDYLWVGFDFFLSKSHSPAYPITSSELAQLQSEYVPSVSFSFVLHPA